ncbi:Yip1-domain-containing protein [Tilletiopsis washingtonensis]|uniref:Protein YIP n=1 Tax=Tilletiopsis washingtonensis TaxID=58919 RepID=A0A316Z8I8_9BASI|nr:Yip1-domain-containing protein [Tilletiopsis washingtonensis]PWN97308.1 Yip1-domain-containing protein [Tilletiopsis washingtonensis]
MSAIFDSSSPYGAAGGGGGGVSYRAGGDPYGGSGASASALRGGGGPSGAAPTGAAPLSFYSSSASDAYGGVGGGGDARPSLEGNMSGSFGAADRAMLNAQMGFWSAFGTGGFPDEPGLMEELGINFSHILDKSLTVLNPVHRYSAAHQRDAHMMDDTDLAGPLIFCFAFGMLLLLSGKSQFGYIYGVALLGDVSIYMLLNMMSEEGIDAYRVASVLGYCLLPLCILAAISVFVALDSLLGYIAAPLFILWSSSSASGIFVSIMRLSEQRFLIAYPVGLLYSVFALLSIFNFGGR